MSRRNPERTADLLAQVRALLDQNRCRDALHLIHAFGIGSPDVSNAYGVCLMRTGELDQALDVYRRLCLNGSVCLRSDASPMHLANYATALLLHGNFRGYLALLRQVPDQAQPALARLRGAVGRWRKSLSVSQRLRLAFFGSLPGQGIELGFPPGELSDEPETAETRAVVAAQR